jgi:hypothetical protein
VPKDRYKSGMTGKATVQYVLNLFKKRVDITSGLLILRHHFDLIELLTKEAPSEDY